MKKSIAFLPEENREDLKYIVSLIRQIIPECEMIILYGSYARGTFVRYDERTEFGIPTSFKSDYDICVIHSTSHYDKIDRKLADIRNKYRKWKNDKFYVPLQTIHDSIKKVNSDLGEGRYFYTELKRDGITLYDSGQYKLARRRKIRFDEIKQYAEKYFEDKYTNAQGFIRGAKFYYAEGDYKLSSFLLHQASENFFKTISLVFTLRSPKEHNLEELLKATRGLVPELHLVFPSEIEEEERLFKILIRAYIEARYNPGFSVSKEDVEMLITRVEQLGKITQDAYQKRVTEYENAI